MNVLVTKHAAQVASFRLQLPGLCSSFQSCASFPLASSGLTETHTFRVIHVLTLAFFSGPATEKKLLRTLGLILLRLKLNRTWRM